MTQRLSLAVILTAFWLMLSGHYTPLLLLLGAGSIALVVWLARRMDIIDREGRPLQLLLRAPRLWAWLSMQILSSAWNVGRRIWSRDAGWSPELRRVDADEMSDLALVTYANSITLTPGTLSVRVDADHIEVHSVDSAYIDDLERGEMARRVRRLDAG